jgi:hypothetical protein
MPNPRKSLTGKRFGFLDVLSPATPARSAHGQSLWVCRCNACDTLTIMPYNTLTYPRQGQPGAVNSCGCQRGRRATPKP